MNQLKHFTIRVYGILINSNNEVLLADEAFSNGKISTKFPGGGMELGEGTIDCLIREFKEETGVDVTAKEHFYTTDFFQQSYFDDEAQIISIYYICESEQCAEIKVSNKKFDFEIVPGKSAESFRWVALSELANEEMIVLPIDIIVVDMLLKRFNGILW